MTYKFSHRKYSYPLALSLSLGALVLTATACSPASEASPETTGLEKSELALLDAGSAKKVGDMDGVEYFAGEALPAGDGAGMCVAAISKNRVLLEGCGTGPSVHVSNSSLVLSYFPRNGGTKPHGYSEVSPGLFVLSK